MVYYLISLFLYSNYSLKYLFVAGEHCDHETRLWAENQFQVPVLDNWWQTETAHAIAATCVGLGNKLTPPKDASGRPVPGMLTVFENHQKCRILNARFRFSKTRQY